MRTRLLAIWALIGLVPCLHADAIDDIVRANMERERIPGIAVGIIDGDLPPQFRTYGIANLETDTPVTTRTVFKIASMSKAFAAAATLLLVEEGRLSLETPITQVLPDAPPHWSEIRVRHLLAHTSGIPDSDLFQFEREYTEAQYLALFWNRPLDSVPGEVYRYNNFAYATLGLVVGRVSGLPLRDFVTERILRPLGMSVTHYYDLPRLVPGRANGYNWSGGRFVNPNPYRPWVYDGSGGMLTNLEEYAKWDRALREQRVLSPTILQRQWTQVPLNNGEPGRYGMGWFPDIRDGRRVVFHGGATQGFTSHVVRDLDRGVTVYVFRNGSGGNVGGLTNAIYQAYLSRS